MRLMFLKLTLITIFLGNSLHAQKAWFVNREPAYLYNIKDTLSRKLLLVHPPSKIYEDETEYKDENWIKTTIVIAQGSQISGEKYVGYIKREVLTDDPSQLNYSMQDSTISFSYSRITTDSITKPVYTVRSSSKDNRCYHFNSAGKREYIKREFCEKPAQEDLCGNKQD